MQATQVALSVVYLRMILLVGLRMTCHVQEVMGLVVVALVSVAALDGNLVTGFAPGKIDLCSVLWSRGC